MRLSRVLGRTKAELLDSLSESELVDQIAFDHLEPLPNDYWRTGLLAEVLTHVLGGSKKKLNPEQWMPGEHMKQMSEAQMKANVRRYQRS
ncbi:MAG: hypothetical protein R3C18_27915 [Planctomycetaceae bacterium]